MSRKARRAEQARLRREKPWLKLLAEAKVLKSEMVGQPCLNDLCRWCCRLLEIDEEVKELRLAAGLKT